MAATDWVVIAVVLVILAMIVIAFLETKYLRKSIRGRRVRAAKRLEQLPDDAHNALITTKAILATLERGGLRSEEAAALMQEAQLAYGRRNYRVVLDLTSKAKEKIMALKARQSAQGDLAKLDSTPSSQPEGEATTKELLQKDFPSNYAPARFSLELAQVAIEKGRESGRDVVQAEALLAHARARFDAEDYSAALSAARQAQRSAETGPLDLPTPTGVPPSAAEGLACAACGTTLQADDVFCRKCGARVASAT